MSYFKDFFLPGGGKGGGGRQPPLALLRDRPEVGVDHCPRQRVLIALFVVLLEPGLEPVGQEPAPHVRRELEKVVLVERPGIAVGEERADLILFCFGCIDDVNCHESSPSQERRIGHVMNCKHRSASNKHWRYIKPTK